MSDLNELIARFEQTIKELDKLDARLDADEAAEQQEAQVKNEAKRAQDARQGKLGPDWQTVQRRIDREETTLAEVFSGADTTPAATRLRDLSRKNLAAMRESSEAESPASGRAKKAMQASVAAATKARDDSHEHYEAVAKEIAARLRRG